MSRRYFDLIRPTAPNNLVQSSDTFGGIEDVYDGFDFDANARLGRGIILSGGVSLGRERTDSCNLANDLSLVFQSGVTALTGSGATILAPRTSAYCDVRPPFQPNVKAQLSYPLPWGIAAALTYQGLAGLQINAQYPLSNTTPGLTLGRPFSSMAPTVDIVPLVRSTCRASLRPICDSARRFVPGERRFVRTSRSTTCSMRIRRTRSILTTRPIARPGKRRWSS